MFSEIARTDAPEYVRMEVWHAPGRSKPTFDEAKRAHYKPLKKGDKFGPSWTNHWVCLAPCRLHQRRTITHTY